MNHPNETHLSIYILYADSIISQGLSYSTSALTIPALKVLSNAADASRGLEYIQHRSTKQVSNLTNITAFSFILAYVLSSPRRKHPYLIWTSLMTLFGGSGLDLYFKRTGGVSLCTPVLAIKSWFTSRLLASSRNVSVGSNDDDMVGNGSEIMIVENEDAQSSSASAPGEETKQDEVNGESVSTRFGSECRFYKIRTSLLAIAFTMTVVGIWGDSQ